MAQLFGWIDDQVFAWTGERLTPWSPNPPPAEPCKQGATKGCATCAPAPNASNCATCTDPTFVVDNTGKASSPLRSIWLHGRPGMQGALPAGLLTVSAPLASPQCVPPAPPTEPCKQDPTKGCGSCAPPPNASNCASCVTQGHVVDATGKASFAR